MPFAALLVENPAPASPDLLRAMVKTFAEAMMSADVGRACRGDYGRPGEERVNSGSSQRLRSRAARERSAGRPRREGVRPARSTDRQVTEPDRAGTIPSGWVQRTHARVPVRD
ncbi:hypothetical protein GXW82_00280 [Streptacidiphilus sp. 4-A2]|nr:hypothetical protein [Streptacidiphilus sp. 4-A2]